MGGPGTGAGEGWKTTTGLVFGTWFDMRTWQVLLVVVGVEHCFIVDLGVRHFFFFCESH